MDSGRNDHLRVSDAERANVGQLLERAVAEGMITLDEFSERYDAALAARTRGELAAVVADLPIEVPPMAPASHRPALAPEELRGWMSSIVRRGQWTVAPALHLTTRLCNTTLDFTSAVLPGPVVEIVIDDYCGSTELIVPSSATADLNGVNAVAGSATVKVRTSPPSDQLHLIVRGRVRMGSVTVRHPFGSWLRRLNGTR
ncbi:MULTISPECIES: DUF1707 domain-containing protein [unclassified Mycolicibacterium]|uniref:DUF1707 SHOCT-like domain-containing protein n=1 Tax=unclassified Mycolicibacterium TaxID=2636767 RepID=UPI0012DE1F3C|nr:MULTISPECIES: DUF1707 domain-containing protein [unclassified Mycolicibacterium]MUL83869.1 DUF1707 domain-containing protein [Mycolicibacterium sp. CBMA 329]MUL90065.1 DUF1707 domain-containing protein [Mycolicibacterium sp. CBMA 331]MUL97915.1 DUF1707 domain-containing protein [Mycolicibacterium sp. CBMA 334]MUM28046.1 DUF1707 domain-containing protein [Mycolicibacterium sp. CBMA 295]MUM39580.1 DUF1707 domain-containing protein [Mycolicibacterium sp. CBMA 247]